MKPLTTKPLPPVSSDDPAQLIALAAHISGLLANRLSSPLDLPERLRVGQRVRRAVPLLVSLTALGMERHPQHFPDEHDAAGQPLAGADLRRRQERAQALQYLASVLQQLAARCQDAYLCEQARAVDDALGVLRRACREPDAPPAPRREALCAALAWWRLGCSFFRLPQPRPTPAPEPGLLVAARQVVSRRLAARQR